MMLPWIAYALLIAAAVTALGVFVERAAGHILPRRFIWTAAMAVTVATPLIASIVAAPRVNTVVVGAADATRSALVAAPSWNVVQIIVSSWIAISALVLLCLVLSHMHLRRALMRCEPATVDGNEVLISDDFGPAVFGVVRTRIVLPGWTLALSAADRHLIVAHEREHIDAHDPVVQAFALALVVLLPWNAPLWWQLKRLRLAIEIDCDARVVRRGHDRVRYGELLVSAHANITRRLSPVLALAQRRSSLAHRIDALVASPHRSLARAAAAFGGSGLLIAVIAATPAPAFRERINVVTRTPSSYVFRPEPVEVVRAEARPAAPVARSTPPRTIREMTLPPASVIPSKLDTELATLPRPVAQPLPPARLRLGGGRGGVFGLVRPMNGVVATGAAGTAASPIIRAIPDSLAGRANVIRAVRPDSTP